MHLLLLLALMAHLGAQAGSDPLLSRLEGKWSGTTMEVVDRVKSKDGSWREFGRSLLPK